MAVQVPGSACLLLGVFEGMPRAFLGRGQEHEQENMKKLTLIAAAIAAGLTGFAHAQENVVQNPAAIAKGAKNEKAEKAEADCQYLFGCNQIDAKDKKPVKKTAEAKADPKPVKKAARKKVVLKSGDKSAVDLVQTASIGKKGSKVASAPTGGRPYNAIIARYAATYGVPVSLAHAVVSVESNYRPNVTGSAGEVGLMQIKPSTARFMGYSGSVKGLYNPETNIKFGMKYLSMAHKLGGGTTCGTILKYNAGHAAKRMNPVSSAYCSKVKRHMGA